MSKIAKIHCASIAARSRGGGQHGRRHTRRRVFTASACNAAFHVRPEDGPDRRHPAHGTAAQAPGKERSSSIQTCDSCDAPYGLPGSPSGDGQRGRAAVPVLRDEVPVRLRPEVRRGVPQTTALRPVRGGPSAEQLSRQRCEEARAGGRAQRPSEGARPGGRDGGGRPAGWRGAQRGARQGRGRVRSRALTSRQMTGRGVEQTAAV
eukprot:COSAG04_NODE_8382_length_983_cov_1.565611_1_plen_206_part_00